MTRRTTVIAIITLTLVCGFETINSATTGYFYEHPISPFNPTAFPPLTPTGFYSGITIGTKVQTSSRPRVTVPPLPSLLPLSSLTQTVRLKSTPHPSAQPTPTTPLTPTKPTTYTKNQLPLQQRPQQQTQPQTFQPQSPNQPQRITSQSPPRPTPTLTQRPTPRPTPIQTQRPAPRPVSTPNPRPLPTESSSAIVPQVTTIPPKRPAPNAVPTSALNSRSNSNQAGLSGNEYYFINGRQLKQYKVYEEIDNDIDHPVENFIPANFFIGSYHNKIGATHPLGEDFQVQSRFGQRINNNNQQRQGSQQSQRQQQQQQANGIAVGSGALGFVRLPNGNIYLGSGSLGYISSLQHNRDVLNIRTRTGAPSPDALHFGHGSLDDSYNLNY